jgi:hypothetical protein
MPGEPPAARLRVFADKRSEAAVSGIKSGPSGKMGEKGKLAGGNLIIQQAPFATRLPGPAAPESSFAQRRSSP